MHLSDVQLKLDDMTLESNDSANEFMRCCILNLKQSNFKQKPHHFTLTGMAKLSTYTCGIYIDFVMFIPYCVCSSFVWPLYPQHRTC